MKLSIAAAIVTMSTTVNARLHPDDDSKKNRELQWGPSKNMVERSLVSPAITAIQGDIDRLEAEDVTLNDQIATANTAIATAETEITELQSDVVLLEAANVTLRDQIATADNAIDTANANITALASRLEEAEATISAAVATINELSALVRALTQSPTAAPVTPPVTPPRIVFVTSVGYTGSLGGISGADVKCQTLAIEAELSGIFKAWLSNSTSWPAKDFDKSGGPFVTTTGDIVANDWQDLITDDGSGVFLNNSIAFDEKGLSTGSTALLPSRFVWTGTTETGMPRTQPGGTFCNDWTSDTSGGAWYGISGFTSQAWTDIGSGYPCTDAIRLYCFEQ